MATTTATKAPNSRATVSAAEWMTGKEVAEILAIPRNAVYRLVEKGILRRRTALPGLNSVYRRIDVEALASKQLEAFK
jgi:predicted DNA-binding transcriptional regulator AlpA